MSNVYDYEYFETRAEYEALCKEMQFESVTAFEKETGADFELLKGKEWELVNNRVLLKGWDKV